MLRLLVARSSAALPRAADLPQGLATRVRSTMLQSSVGSVVKSAAGSASARAGGSSGGSRLAGLRCFQTAPRWAFARRFGTVAAEEGAFTGQSTGGAARSAAAEQGAAAAEATVGSTASTSLQEGGLVKSGYEKLIGMWLLGSAGMLYSMIAIGGYTRLSGSGLSMTDWRIQGRSLPRSEEAWVQEFEEYKKYPEYQRLHAGMMELSEFKRIYFVEWFHRMWGRSAGVLFGVPLAYFAVRGIMRPKLIASLSGLFALGLSQAFIGWWMVRSGFDPPEKHVPTQGSNQRPRVSPYRLASHWTAALTLYAGCMWHAFGLLRPSPAATHSSAEALAAAKRLRGPATLAAAIVAITLLSGPFVAGNDAGHAYNTWPRMIDDWVPPEWSAAVAEPAARWRAFFEDTAVVQFNHRSLAYLSVLSTLSVFAYSTCLPVAPAVGAATRLLPLAVSGQMCLGIATLLLYVPIELGVAHQAGGVAVLTALLYVLHTLRLPAVPVLAAAAAAA